MATKQLSLIHLTMGQQLLGRLTEDPDAALKLVGIYRATAGNLVKARRDQAVMDALIDDAAEVQADEAQECLQDFFGQLTRYMSAIGTSLPQPTPEQMELLKTLALLKDLKDQEKAPTS